MISTREEFARRYFARRHWGAGEFRRVRKPCSETQCRGDHDAERWWQIYVPNRRWNSQSVWRTSGYLKIQLNMGSSQKRRSTQRWSSRRSGRVSADRHIDGWQGGPKRFFGRSKGSTSIVTTLNEEVNSTCPRKNHSQHQCDTWTRSGEHIRPWTRCKKPNGR